MKKIFKIACLILLAANLSGCKDFLDLPAKNERVIQSLDDVKMVLAGYLKGVATPATETSIVGQSPLFSPEMIKMFEAYSDNIDFEKAVPDHYLLPQNSHGTMEQYRTLLLWNDYDTPKAIWEKYYEVIGFLNALIDEMPVIRYDDQHEWNRVMGEMLTHRGYYFFKLLQYFAPYHDNALGIPVYLHTGQNVLNVNMGRKSHTEVYGTILTNLSEAARLLSESAPREGFNTWFDTFRVNHILAQVYWFKAGSPAREDSDYGNAASHAAKAIAAVNEEAIPRTATQLLVTNGGQNTEYPAMIMRGRSYGSCGMLYGSPWYYMSFNPKDVPVSREFYDSFSSSDIRFGELFSSGGWGGDTYVGYFSAPYTLNIAWPDAIAYASGASWGFSVQNNGRAILFRPEEAYLIQAEGLYHSGDTPGAVAALNKFKSFRNSGTATGLSGEALLNEIMIERRKEFFCDTDKRWLDLKKYGGVNLRRQFLFDKVYDKTVEPGGYQYALPIPIEELRENGNLTQNPGWTGAES